MKVLYTSFINGDRKTLSQYVIDIGDISLNEYIANEAGLDLEDLIGTPDQPSVVDPLTWIDNEFGICINDGLECAESYFYIS